MSTNIIETKNMIPAVMRQSRDMQAICKVLDLLINSFKTDVDYFPNLIDYDACPDQLLPALASYVGYKYDYTESFDTNRLIIKHYAELIRNRGSEIGMALATALSVNTLGEIDKLEALSMFNFDYVAKDHKLYIYIYFPADLTKMRNSLIEVVRPAGCGVSIIGADVITDLAGIQIHSYTEAQKYAYTNVRYSVGDDSKVAHSEVTNEARK